jgi:transcriptional regulator NrdR family protein
MSKQLGKAVKKRHIQSGGMEVCPFCKANVEEVVVYGSLDPVENGDIEQRAECNECGRRWIDVFRLIDIREICTEEVKQCE